MSHQPNELCKYPDVSKALWCSFCGSEQNDHTKGCPAEKGTGMTTVCRNFGDGEDTLKKTAL